MSFLTLFISGKKCLEKPLYMDIVIGSEMYYLVQRYSNSFKSVFGMFVWIFILQYTFFKTKSMSFVHRYIGE